MQWLAMPVLFLRGLLVTIYFYLHTLVCASAVILLALDRRGVKVADWVILHLWAKPIVALAGIRLETRGLENWPRGQGFLILFNHASWMDIVFLSCGIPRVPRFGAKIELFSIPFFGRAMRNVGTLPIERQNRTKVLQVYKEAEKRAKAGEVFGLAPEGTRQTTLELGKFKQGPFLFAMGAQIQIVPIVIAGARETMPKGSGLINPWHRHLRVILEILPPIATVGLSEDQVQALQDQVRSAMAPVYARLNRELGLQEPGQSPRAEARGP